MSLLLHLNAMNTVKNTFLSFCEPVFHFKHQQEMNSRRRYSRVFTNQTPLTRNQMYFTHHVFKLKLPWLAPQGALPQFSHTKLHKLASSRDLQ